MFTIYISGQNNHLTFREKGGGCVPFFRKIFLILKDETRILLFSQICQKYFQNNLFSLRDFQQTPSPNVQTNLLFHKMGKYIFYYEDTVLNLLLYTHLQNIKKTGKIVIISTYIAQSYIFLQSYKPNMTQYNTKGFIQSRKEANYNTSSNLNELLNPTPAVHIMHTDFQKYCEMGTEKYNFHVDFYPYQ